MRLEGFHRLRSTVLCTVLVSCSAPPAAEPSWEIVPGRSAGAIEPVSTERDLVEAYGQDVVQPNRIELGEGETAPGTVLFPNDSTRRLEIIWRDTVARGRPVRLVWRGSQSKWQLPSGISLGSSLKEIESLNGRPFMLAGFGWDYAGVVLDWDGGALASTSTGIRLYLSPSPAHHPSQHYDKVLGDRDYSSSNPAMQALNPTVYQIFMDFE